MTADRPVADREPLSAELQRLADELDHNADWRGDKAKVAVAAMQSVAGSLNALARTLDAARSPDETGLNVERLASALDAPGVFDAPLNDAIGLARDVAREYAALTQPAVPVAGAEDELLAAWRRTKDFLADRLATSGRSDVNINAVLRVMNSAFEDRAAHPEDDGLDAAWKEIDVETVRAALTVMDEAHGSGWSATGYLTPEQRAADLLAAVVLVRLRTPSEPSDTP